MNQVPPLIEPLAFFGGTFDPVHYGHVRCADEARTKLGLENMFLLPSGAPPHRAQPLTTSRQRLDMLELALREFPSLRIDPRETLREGPSYMVETLQELRAESPQSPLLLLVGQDAANLLHTWFRWRELFLLAHLVILTRPHIDVDYHHDVAEEFRGRLLADPQELLTSTAGAVMQLEVVSIDVSATHIKESIREGRSLEALMPEKVIDYIRANGLYLPT
jgi:nicotinate-nucleotide adenylyltransferase